MTEMESIPSYEEEEDDHHHSAIIIWEVKKERLATMHLKMSESPTLVRNTAGNTSCSIFRVPQSLIEINGKSYQPQIVSIGPYHQGEPHLKMIEQHKWRYLKSLLSRTQDKGLSLEHYLKAVQPLEMKARECYSQSTLHLNSDEFIEMMVLDGVFIIELFRKVGNIAPVEFDDPLFSMSWIFSFFLRDLLCLENQIPFFVLQSLFDISIMDREASSSLAKLALDFFNNALQRPDEQVIAYDLDGNKHLLDLLRSSFITPLDEHEQQSEITNSHVIQCVSKLRKSGIKFRPPGESNSFLSINFKHGVIEMPTITIDDFMTSFLLNCVAFEQCSKHCSKHFTTYATMLDYLINTSKDVEYLCDSNIIDNYFGTDAEMAKFINNLGKDVTFDIYQCYLAKFFNDVHHYYRNSWHVQWAGFKYTYFATPWSFISALAAVILLILTVLQTFYTVLGYYPPPPNSVG